MIQNLEEMLRGQGSIDLRAEQIREILKRAQRILPKSQIETTD